MRFLFLMNLVESLQTMEYDCGNTEYMIVEILPHIFNITIERWLG